MYNDDFSRREFLKKFAVLSGGALMLSATAMACYGPMPPQNSLPSVVGMYCYDAGLNKVELQGNQNVLVNTAFEIDFSKNMNTTAQTAIQFTDSNSVPVDIAQAWDDSRTLRVTPASDLSYDTEYTLSVEDAWDTAGNPLNGSRSAATFRSAIA
jgi:hypothetical protein